MLHAQLQPSLLAGATWSSRKTSIHGCQSCVAVLLPLRRASCSVPTAAFWDEALSKNRQVSSIWFHQQGEHLRFRGRITKSMLMTTREDAGQPAIIESSSQTIPKEARLESASGKQYSATVSRPSILPRTLQVAQLSLLDQAFLLVGLIVCATSFALFALIVTAIPTLNAMRRAAVSVEKLADVAREELPGTMAAIRLSGMEISDLTLELNDLSQEISDGMRNSSRAVQAAEVGIRQISSAAASQTFAMLQERASVPVQVVRPAVVSAAATTLHAVSQAQKLVLSLASSSYPRISGWLGQKGNSEKPEKSQDELSSAAVTLTELLTGEESPEASLLSGGPPVAMFDTSDDDNEGKGTPVPSAKDN